MTAINIDRLTKDYGERRGCFNLSFEVEKGEVFGFLGPNGAGKTTTIRHLLGFLKPDSGASYIDGKSTWNNAHIINANVGYLPGEINFPDKMNGMELIRWMAEMRGTKSLDKAKYLLDLFELNANSDVKRMSKGMKQKIGIVCAFMHDSKILILDEPTSGLDPLMQELFVDLVSKEKSEGKTILMSSHMFAEVEKTCDRVAIIKNGEIVTQVEMADISKPRSKVYKLKFAVDGDSKRFVQEHKELDFAEINHEKNRVKVRVDDKDINRFVAVLPNYKLNYVSEIKLTLEDYFMRFYSSKNNEQGGMKNVI
jgi:ABC-2 type transport system ATP-binding protein